MPRRNKPIIASARRPLEREGETKRTYRSKREADMAIRRALTYYPDLSLKAYLSPIDGLWRLTSKNDS